jgi:mannose-6-phosphate isomerase-like protein (cupin superfamily)
MTISRRVYTKTRAGKIAAAGYKNDMKHIPTGNVRAFFKVLASTASSQAAIMVLRPGQSTGEVQNEHPRSEQWLFVVSGSGKATVGKRRVALRENSLLLIEKGEAHQVVNTGNRTLTTINFYAPPAYTKDGEVKPQAKR